MSKIEQFEAELERFEDWKFGVACHLGFDRKWIKTIHWRPMSHNAPAY